MKKTFRFIALVMAAAIIAAVLVACGGGAKDALAGTWRQTDDVNGNWTWTFDGSGKCTLLNELVDLNQNGTYSIDEAAGTVKVKMELWDDEKVYTYTLTDTTLDLESTLSSYHLTKQ